jgi:hypothetical protein
MEQCQICKHRAAEYDAKIPTRGYWAFVCGICFTIYGCKLGLGSGQKLEGVVSGR